MNVYLAQFSIDYGFSTSKNILYFPYSAGCIWAYANQFEEVKKNYTLKEFFVEKEDPEKLVNSLDDPKIFGFSSYVWNSNYSLKVAELVKRKYPNCVTIFGGPHVPTGDESWLKKYPFVDYVCYKEGEIVFYNLLLRIAGLEHSTKGMGFIEKGKLNKQQSPERIMDLAQLPSPYTNGYFDNLISKYAGTNMVLNTVIETNRGCPFKCTFCDWGGMTESKVKKFEMCRVHEEILWVAKNKLEFVISADANFGAFKERDMEITDFLIETKTKFGYPKYFDTSWHKNQGIHLVEMAKKLMDAGMMKRYSASLQSTTKSVLQAIKRKNIGENVLLQIKELCEKNGFGLFTDLMMPLPEETYESFEACLEQCLENNIAFNAVYTTIMPNAEMNTSEYRKKYGLQTAINKFVEPHSWAQEEEEVVVGTNSMSKKEFNNIALVAYLISGFHLAGFTDLIAKYYKKTEGITFTSFYKYFLDYFTKEKHTLVHQHIGPLANHVDDKKTNRIYGGVRFVPMFNDLGQKNRERFFGEVKEFCRHSLPDNINLDDLIQLQYNWQDHTQNAFEIDIKCKSNLFDYVNGPSPFVNSNHVYSIKAKGKKKNFISLGHFLAFAKPTRSWNTSIKVKS
jgi:radical SAM superfamily enzyme YgiQ (UPF0313 family)